MWVQLFFKAIHDLYNQNFNAHQDFSNPKLSLNFPHHIAKSFKCETIHLGDMR